MKTITEKKHPDWALKHKRKGTELRLIKGKYYLYEVKSKWNPEKGRAQKITGKFLGRITEKEGFIESEKLKLKEEVQKLTTLLIYTKEYGASYFILNQFSEYREKLKQCFPSLWKEIFILAFIRLAYQTPIKNIGFKYENSYLSEIFTKLSLTDKNVSALLKKIGAARESAVKFMQSFISGGDYVLVDGTHILSNSKNIEIVKPGYNPEDNYAPQFIYYFFSLLN
jgi:hypothetical protein